jgi:hypothetical protein
LVWKKNLLWATADKRPTPRLRDIILFGKWSHHGEQLTAGPRLDMEKLFGVEKWSPRGQQLTASPHLDIDKLFGLENGAHVGNSWQQTHLNSRNHLVWKKGAAVGNS